MLQLKTTCAPNPRIQPLVDGEVLIEDVNLAWNLTSIPMLFRNNIEHDDFELSEMSISETMLTLDRKEVWSKGRWDWWALPIFLARGHFWGGIVVNADSGIKDLRDLKGKEVGVPDYCMTGALWMRITLKDLYGIETQDISWHNLRPREESQAFALGLEQDPPPGVTVNWDISDDPITLLERGELDAAIGLSGHRLDNNPKIRKLMPDDGKEVIAEFFKQTGCFQPNHHFIVQRRLIQDDPNAAVALFEAFATSKQLSYRKAREAQAAYLYFPGRDFANQAQTYGDDPYPMGLTAMRKTLERAMYGSLEQGLIRNPVLIDDIYHPSLRST